MSVRRHPKALYCLNTLQDLDYIQYFLDLKTWNLTYSMIDWAVKCSGKLWEDSSVFI